MKTYPKPAVKKPIFGKVPRLWPDSTFVCLATGPSLCVEDVEYVRYVRGKGKARVIAVNNAYQLAPWADVMYACDDKFWMWQKGAPDFQGLKFAMQPAARRWPGVQVLKNTGRRGVETDRTGLRTGQNSGYQAINLAIHLGARTIILLGYDMQRTGGESHYFGHHPDHSKPPFSLCIPLFETLLEPLKKLGIAIVNCTRATAIKCFPQQPLHEVLH